MKKNNKQYKVVKRQYIRQDLTSVNGPSYEVWWKKINKNRWKPIRYKMFPFPLPGEPITFNSQVDAENYIEKIKLGVKWNPIMREDV